MLMPSRCRARDAAAVCAVKMITLVAYMRFADIRCCALIFRASAKARRGAARLRRALMLFSAARLFITLSPQR